jgi:hypothetical protein
MALIDTKRKQEACFRRLVIAEQHKTGTVLLFKFGIKLEKDALTALLSAWTVAIF